MSRRFFERAFFFLIVFSVFCAAGALAAERMEAVDQDGDGKPERWDTFDSHGQMKTLASDSNHDGKPDFFQEYFK